MNKEQVTIFTDGACSGNPGPGGYGTILICRGKRRELSEGFRWTTNNRMEMMALVGGLEALKRPCELEIHTDSTYLLGGFQKGWIENWKKNGWRTSAKKPVQNRDLWQRLDALLAQHSHTFIWVKGHADSADNNRCDELGVQAREERATEIDEGYEAENPFPVA